MPCSCKNNLLFDLPFVLGLLVTWEAISGAQWCGVLACYWCLRSRSNSWSLETSTGLAKGTAGTSIPGAVFFSFFFFFVCVCVFLWDGRFVWSGVVFFFWLFFFVFVCVCVLLMFIRFLLGCVVNGCGLSELHRMICFMYICSLFKVWCCCFS